MMLRVFFFSWPDVKKRMNQALPVKPDSNKGGTELPVSLSTEPIVGYRTWRVHNDGTGFVLRSLIQRYVWQVDNTAECRVMPPAYGPLPPDHKEPVPGVKCQCGLYTVRPDQTTADWDSHVRGRVRAYGQAALTGRVIVCDRGYKAQHARILSPVTLDVDCCHNETPYCDQPVTRISLPGLGGDYNGWCDTHSPTRAESVVVEAAAFMREAVRQLEARYEGVTFQTFI